MKKPVPMIKENTRTAGCRQGRKENLQMPFGCCSVMEAKEVV